MAAKKKGKTRGASPRSERRIAMKKSAKAHAARGRQGSKNYGASLIREGKRAQTGYKSIDYDVDMVASKLERGAYNAKLDKSIAATRKVVKTAKNNPRTKSRATSRKAYAKTTRRKK